MSQEAALRTAIVARLRADVNLMSRVTGVYDGRVPDGVKLPEPYIVVGEGTEVPVRLIGKKPGDDNTLTIRVWDVVRTPTEWLGYTRVAEIRGIAEKVLLAGPITITGRSPVRLRTEQALTVPQPNPEKIMGLIRLRAKSLENV